MLASSALALQQAGRAIGALAPKAAAVPVRNWALQFTRKYHRVSKYQRFLILGGAGLVGTQVCRQIIRELGAKNLVVTDLNRSNAEAAVKLLEAEFGTSGCKFVPSWGNIFVPTTLSNRSPKDLMNDPAARKLLLEKTYGDFDACFQDNHLKTLLELHKPDVVVDCVNTATGLAYQDVFTGASNMLDWIKTDDLKNSKAKEELEVFLLSQSVPQLIRHVKILHRATTELSTQLYLKVGTTGTGGMGLNIPYTHSEDRPSNMLLAKNEAAFGQTGLLFLLGRTPQAPIIKEIKPAAMIGYRQVMVQHITDKNGNNIVYEPKPETVEPGTPLGLKPGPAGFTEKGPLQVTVVSTGENGNFAKGEFGAITASGSMEFLTPEEIASTVLEEIMGINTGKDFINACDATAMGSSYKAGILRSLALRDLAEVERDVKEHNGHKVYPSVALGKLGPPELSKLLIEARLLKETFGTISNFLRDSNGAPRTPKSVVEAVTAQLEASDLRAYAPSIGIPILKTDNDGCTVLLRGPRINIPEVGPHRSTVDVTTPADVEAWAAKGWVDLRGPNLLKWTDRCQELEKLHGDLKNLGSAAVEETMFAGNTNTSFEEGDIIAYIFHSEFQGSRIK